MMSVENLVRGSIGLMTALLLAPAAGALNITGLSITTLAGNTANSSSTNGNNNTQVAFATSTTIAPSGPVADTIGSAISFQTNYDWLVMADRDNNGNGAISNTATADYQITFTVDNPLGHTYQIDIDTLRLGALTAVTDHSGDSTTTLGAVTGSVDAITNASLALAGITLPTSTASGNVDVNQSSTTLSLTSSAVSQLWTLRFTWTGTATSNNDESAIRMGIAGTVAGVTADDYPGTGARTLANDGHFVTVNTQIISAPEPTTSALVAIGLLGLVMRGRAGARARARS
jgi:hypothetical protein